MIMLTHFSTPHLSSNGQHSATYIHTYVCEHCTVPPLFWAAEAAVRRNCVVCSNEFNICVEKMEKESDRSAQLSRENEQLEESVKYVRMFVHACCLWMRAISSTLDACSIRTAACSMYVCTCTYVVGIAVGLHYSACLCGPFSCHQAVLVLCPPEQPVLSTKTWRGVPWKTIGDMRPS